MTRKVLITGAGGYIGSALVESLLASSWEVIALDRFFFGNPLQHHSNKKISIVRDDIRFCDAEMFNGVYAVIHLASISNDPAAALDLRITTSINHEGSVRLAHIAKERGVKKFIFASSCSIYGGAEDIVNEESPVNPVSAYAKSKIASECSILPLSSKDFWVTSLRNATVYGVSLGRMRFDLMVNLMTLHAWQYNKVFIMGGGKQWRPLIHIDDLVRAFMTILAEEQREKVEGQVINVGSNEQNYQVRAVANKLKTFFPGLVIEEVPDDPDPRNYRVCFDKILTRFGFAPQKTIEDAVVEIRSALERGSINDDIRTITVKYYKWLKDAEETLSRVKLKNTLFLV